MLYMKKTISYFIYSHTSVKLRTPRDNEYGSPINQEPMMRPQDRQAMYQSLVDQELAKRKQEDHGWEDVVEVIYLFYVADSILMRAL